MNDVKIFNYSDIVSRLALWQKAIFLVPLWGFFVVPIVGAISIALGSFVADVGYTLTIAACLSWFIEDVLKTKIRIQNGRLFHGYKKFTLAQLASVGLEYKADQMLPQKLVLNFIDGKKYKLKISRLKAADAEALVKLVEARHPAAKVDPVLRTLSKCKRLAGTTALDMETQVEIPYQSRLLFEEMRDTFLQTCYSWLRAGPILCFLLCTIVWYGTFETLFKLFNQAGAIKQGVVRNILAQAADIWCGCLGWTMAGAGSTLSALLTNPAVAIFLFTLFLVVSTYLIRYVLRPNVLMLGEKGMTLSLRLGSLSFALGQTGWSALGRIHLQLNAGASNLDRSQIIFEGSTGKRSIKINLSGLKPDNRRRFLKAIERLAPACTIDPQLSEALMPKQERSYTELWLQSLSAPPERKNLEPFEPGQKLRDGRFVIMKRLGVGGQGSAYMAQQVVDDGESLPADVVLKETILPVFVESTVREQALQRFQHEAEMLGKLRSDQIVNLIDYFIEDHRGYLVLEHIEGKSLRQLVDDAGCISERQAIDLGVQMSGILANLHSQGIIHRDFTPDNLILTKSGKLKLIDFNVAQSAESGSTGTIVGKHAFLPPEQFRGKPTYQSDIYALGATLFFMTAGVDPEPISICHPRESSAETSQAFDDVVARCTQLQASARFTDASQVREALLRLYDTERSATIETKQRDAIKNA